MVDGDTEMVFLQVVSGDQDGDEGRGSEDRQGYRRSSWNEEVRFRRLKLDPFGFSLCFLRTLRAGFGVRAWLGL